jgi:glycosyltransferase involved in cell wall biosynthesis
MFDIAVDCRELEKDKKTGLGRILTGLLKELSKKHISVLAICDIMTDKDILREILGDKVAFTTIKRKSNAYLDQLMIPLCVFGKSKRFFSIYPKFPVVLPFFGVDVFIYVADVINFSFSQKLFLKLFGRLPKKVMTLSKASKKKIEQIIRRKDIEVTYSDISYVKEWEKKIDDGFAKNFGNFILYVGNFNPHKNVRTLIKAFELIKDRVDLNLVLCGGGGKKAENFQETDRVKILKGLSDGKIASLYKNCMFFVFPSFEEGIGLPGIEACYFGKAVLVSDIEVFREIFGNSAIFFDPKSPKDLAEKILTLYNSKELREIYGKKAKKVGDFFASLDIGQKLYSIIF